MTVEMMMMVIALIAIFITILGGFGSMVAFLWQQFSKINATLQSIKFGYVTDDECEKRRHDCKCDLDIQKIRDHMGNRGIHHSSNEFNVTVSTDENK